MIDKAYSEKLMLQHVGVVVSLNIPALLHVTFLLRKMLHVTQWIGAGKWVQQRQ